MKTNISFAVLLIGLSIGTSHAASTLLYSENFNGEGTAPNAHDNGTTPEINVGGIPALQSTGTSQGNNAADTAWSYATGGPAGTVGQFGLRFGGGYNWATGANSALILADGGFTVSFNYVLPAVSADNWFSVRVGNGPENAPVNLNTVTFGALARADGRIETWDNGAPNGFGTATAAAPRSAQFRYAFNSWAAGSTVTFTGIIDGNPIASDTFTWDATNDVKIVFGGSVAGTLIDNIVVSTIPEPTSALLGAVGALALLRRRRN